jgi:hypothetical protein
MTVTARARVATERPERFLAQLCDHAAAMSAGGPTHHAGPRAADVQRSDAAVTITFPGLGECSLRCADDALDLRVSGSAAGVAQITRIVAADLERFGRRSGLAVAWQRQDPPEGVSR